MNHPVKRALRRCCGIFLAALLFLFPAAVVPRAQEDASPGLDEQINSQAAVLMDAATGQILYEKNMDDRLYPASITKILTAVVALEEGDLSDTVTMTGEAIDAVDPQSTHIALTYDEQVPMQDLFYAMLMMSANDASNGIAVHVGGSLAHFVELMNEKAREIGAVDSHFVNANGLYSPEHYTTARDMALITRYALGYPKFREAFGKLTYTMPPTNKQKDSREFYTQSAMMNPTLYHDDTVTGAKLGWTDESKHTMVTLAQRDGRELICVVMYSQKKYDKYKDTRLLLDYGFDNFEPVEVTVPSSGETQIPILVTGRDFGNAQVTVPSQVTVYLHRDIEKSTLRVTQNLPSSLSGIPKENAYFLTVKCEEPQGKMYGVLREIPLAVDISSEVLAHLEEALVQSAGAPVSAPLESSHRVSWIEAVGWGLLCMVLSAAAVIFGIRFYNLKIRPWRNQRRKKNQP